MDKADDIPNTTSLEPLPERPCPVCAMGQVGCSRTRDINLGKLSPYQVAAEFNCSVEEVMTHINGQHEIQVTEDGTVQSQDFYLNELGKTLTTLKKWTKFVVESVNNKNDIDRAKVEMLTKLVQETRKTIETLAELQGRKGPGDVIIKYNALQKQMIDITDLILQEVPPSCQVKIVNEMDKRGLLPKKTSTTETPEST